MVIFRKKNDFLVVLLFIVVFFGCNADVEKTKKENIKLNVAVFDGNGASATCVLETYEALKIDSGINPVILSASQIIDEGLKDIDVLIFPGGSGSKELNNLGNAGAEIVRNFVTKSGNGILGICAGGYLLSTTKDYPSLRLISATEWDREHYDKGRALVEFELTDVGKKYFPELTGKKCFLQYYDGPVLMPSDSGRTGRYNYVELAKYVTDVKVHEGYPSGVTPGKTFFLMEKVGNGTVVVSAGHPEATPGMRWLVPRMARMAAGVEFISYDKKWINPGINDTAILYTKELVKKEKKLFWILLDTDELAKVDAMQMLYEMRSRPAVRWFIGLLRDNSPLVRKKAAELLRLTEYSAAINDLEIAYKMEKNADVRDEILKTLIFFENENEK